MVTAASVTPTEATGTGATFTTAVAVFPCEVALMVAEPAASAVTSPLAETAATAGWLLDQANVAPGSTAPAASFITAVSCALCPGESAAPAGVIDGIGSPVGTTRAWIDAD